MRNSRIGWFVFCGLVGTLGCRTSSTEWNGAWILNASKSNFQGPSITISISADGEYRYDDGKVSSTFRCDGEYRPIGNNRTQNCVKSSPTTLDRTRKENGIKTNIYHWELSAGGKVFTSTATALRPSGPVITGQFVVSRMSGSDGFAGKWVDTSFLRRHAYLTLRLDSQYLHIGYPGEEQYVDAPLNGADAAVYGPHAEAGMTCAIRRSGQHEFLILGKRNGKAFAQESLELSSDGRVITDSWWNPDKPAEKASLVYEKK